MHGAPARWACFPEQAENWDWIGRQVRRSARCREGAESVRRTREPARWRRRRRVPRSCTSMLRGPVVSWARRNAELSQLADAPIRWIVDDARKFVERELRRGQQYDGVILDPPTYGHGPQAEPWQLDRDLPELLAACGA